jgi:carbamoyl-phosphate synthase large subunit
MPKPNNVFYIRYAYQLGATVNEVHTITKIDPWFLHNLKQIVDFEEELYAYSVQPS